MAATNKALFVLLALVGTGFEALAVDVESGSGKKGSLRRSDVSAVVGIVERRLQKPPTCGCPGRCIPSVLSTRTGDTNLTCGKRIKDLMTLFGNSEYQACQFVAIVEFPLECGSCDPNGCDNISSFDTCVGKCAAGTEKAGATCTSDSSCGGTCSANTVSKKGSTGPGGPCSVDDDCEPNNGKKFGYCVYVPGSCIQQCTALTNAPTRFPTDKPITITPTTSPTNEPATSKPTQSPIEEPANGMPTNFLAEQPTTSDLTNDPTNEPVTSIPTTSPTGQPVTVTPTKSPTDEPITHVPTEFPTNEPVTSIPTTSPTDQPVMVTPTKSPTDELITHVPTNDPTNEPVTSIPTTSPTNELVTNVPTKSLTDDPVTFSPTNNPTNEPLTSVPTNSPTDDPATNPPTNNPTTRAPVSESNPQAPRAQWMSGKHGIGYRVPGGVGVQTASYDPVAFANQISTNNLPISYVIIGISSGAFGDEYLAPHSVLTSLNRASTPRDLNIVGNPLGFYESPFYFGNSSYAEILDFDLESYSDRDVFSELLVAMNAIGVKVIAYAAAQGPAMLKAGESAAYDYNNKSPYVDSTLECASLASGAPCAPSVRKWVEWVHEKYNVSTAYNFDDAYVDGSALNIALKTAYAEIIVGEFAERYGTSLAGWWFDQGDFADGPLLEQIVHEYNPSAVIAFNDGEKIPLLNGNPGVEDFTFGHMSPLKSIVNGEEVRQLNPSDGCYNYGMVLSVEGSDNGYVYQTVSDDRSYADLGATAVPPRPTSYSYTPDEYPSLAHMFIPLNEQWNSGKIVWNVTQAREWQSRVINAGGAWTWNVARSGCAYCQTVLAQELVDEDDLAFLLEVYAGLESVSAPYTFDDTNCECCTPSLDRVGFQWGCLESAVCSIVDPVTNEVRNYGLLDTPVTTTTTTLPGCVDDPTWTYYDVDITKTCASTSWLTDVRCCRECGYSNGATSNADAVVANIACGCTCGRVCSASVPENTQCVLGQSGGRWDQIFTS